MTITIETLKADLAAAQSRIADLELLNRTQLAGWEDESRRLRADILLVAGRDDDAVLLTLGSLRGEIATLSADLERVTGELDEAKRVSNAHCMDAIIATSRLEKAEKERDEARAKVAGLTLSPLAIKCLRRALVDASNDYENAHSDTDATIIPELDRYAEALGGVR